MHNSTLMKLKLLRFLAFPLLLAASLLALELAGCSTPNNQGLMDPPSTGSNILARINVGDTLLITLAGPPEALIPQEKPVNEDGTITLPDIGRIQAAGKTPGDLEDYIHDRYVPRIYTHLTVTIKVSGENRTYFVRGEVKSPGRLVYVGPITVTKAITSAGDFTDFANRKKIILVRSTGKRFKLDAESILNGDAPDPPVYPGDQIEVMRRLL